MTTHRFFRLLWRVNAVIVAGAGLAVIGGSMILTVVLYLDGRQADPVVKAETPPAVSQKLVFGSFSPVAGTSAVLVPLEQEGGGSGFASSGRTSSVTRNLLFIDLSSGNQRWLIEGRNALIRHFRTIERETIGDEEAETIAILVEVVNSDTNGDGSLDSGDRVAVAFVKPDGTGYTEVIADIDRLLGSRQIDDEFLIGYEREGAHHIAAIQLSDFKVASTHAIKMPAAGK